MPAPTEFTRRARAITLAAFRLLIVLWILAFLLTRLFPEIHEAAGMGQLVSPVATIVNLAQYALAIAALWFLHPRIVNWIWPMPRPGCPECGYPIVPNSKVCPECGKPLPT